MAQAARRLKNAVDGFLALHRVLICDRDAKWTDGFRALLEGAGVRIVRTPVQAPNANAYAERFVRSIREECLDRLILLGERRLLHVQRVRGALPRGAESSGARQRFASAGSSPNRQRRSSLPRTFGRPVALLLPGSMSVGRISDSTVVAPTRDIASPSVPGPPQRATHRSRRHCMGRQ